MLGLSTDSIGQFAALLAALTWAFAVVLFKRCGNHLPPLSLNIFKNTVGIILLVATLALSGSSWAELAAHQVGDILILAISGVLGIALADTLFFHGLNRIGVGLMSVVDCTYSPFTILFSFLLLGEAFTGRHAAGTAMILTGVFISSRHRPPTGKSGREIIGGMLMGVGAMGLMAVGIVFAKPVLDLQGFPLIWATLIRMAAGTIALLVLAAASPRRRNYLRSLRPDRSWLLSILASFLGAYLAMIFWVAGFKYTHANVAAVLNQTSVVFQLILATLILKEALTTRKLAAISLALGGVLVILWPMH